MKQLSYFLLDLTADDSETGQSKWPLHCKQCNYAVGIISVGFYTSDPSGDNRGLFLKFSCM